MIRKLALATFLLVLAMLALRSHTAAGPADAFDVKPFFPVAAGVSIQMLERPDASGANVRVCVRLDAAGIKALAEATGQTRVARISEGRVEHRLRDDGRGGDARAGDGEFTFDMALPLEEIFARGELERKLARQGRLRNLPVFEGRELVARADRPAFDIERFRAGGKVEIAPLPVGPAFTTAFDIDFFFLVYYALFPSIVDEVQNPVITDPNRTWNPCTQEGNPDGPWTFKHIMTGLAGGQDPSAFAEHWITLYTEDQTTAATNGFTVEALGFGADNFIDQWREDSGGGALDLEKAPFRLMAIIPRIDLRTGGLGPYGGGSNDGGELRFIFGAVRNPLTTCQPIDFSVIVEYGVPKTSCSEIRQWARDWIDLVDIALYQSEEDYAQALEDLTTQITAVDAEPGNPNGSALNQLRSNEISLGSGCCWRIREFHLESSGMLEQATTAATPDRFFKGGDPWYQYFDALILTPSLPAPPLVMAHPTLPSVNFLGAEALVPFPDHNATPWGFTSDLDFSANPDLSAERHRRGLATCDGCHGPETQTQNAHMVNPVNGEASPFLFGGGTFDPDVPHTVQDPVDPSVEHAFFDLLNRANDIQSVANSLCGPLVAVDMLATAPLEQVH